MATWTLSFKHLQQSVSVSTVCQKNVRCSQLHSSLVLKSSSVSVECPRWWSMIRIDLEHFNECLTTFCIPLSQRTNWMMQRKTYQLWWHVCGSSMHVCFKNNNKCYWKTTNEQNFIFEPHASLEQIWFWLVTNEEVMISIWLCKAKYADKETFANWCSS